MVIAETSCCDISKSVMFIDTFRTFDYISIIPCEGMSGDCYWHFRCLDEEEVILECLLQRLLPLEHLPKRLYDRFLQNEEMWDAHNTFIFTYLGWASQELRSKTQPHKVAHFAIGKTDF